MFQQNTKVKTTDHGLLMEVASIMLGNDTAKTQFLVTISTYLASYRLDLPSTAPAPSLDHFVSVLNFLVVFSTGTDP